jgi:hypothetical protein
MCTHTRAYMLAHLHIHTRRYTQRHTTHTHTSTYTTRTVVRPGPFPPHLHDVARILDASVGNGGHAQLVAVAGGVEHSSSLASTHSTHFLAERVCVCVHLCKFVCTSHTPVTRGIAMPYWSFNHTEQANTTRLKVMWELCKQGMQMGPTAHTFCVFKGI